MNEIFSESTTAQIDAKLHRDILEHEDKIEKACIIIFFVILFLFRGWIGYWLKFGIAIPSKFDSKPIITTEEPVQTNYTKEEQEQKTFKYTTLINNYKIKIIPKAYYKLSGLTITYTYNSFLISDFFSSTALFDIGTAWGKLGNKTYFNKYFESYCSKSGLFGSSYIYTNAKMYPIPVSDEYFASHWSASNLIPANRNIMAALLKIKKWDNILIEGELVDIEFVDKHNYNQKYKTSLYRNDKGNGASEIIYVKKVKIGNKIYQ